MIPKGYIYGLTLANNASYPADRIDFAPGEASSDDASPVVLSLASMTKNLAANWSAGNGNGMRCSGSIANVTYHYFLVGKANGTTDIFAHTSPLTSVALAALQAMSGGADFVYGRRLLSLPRISGAIIGFTQFGNMVQVNTPVADYQTTTLGTGGVVCDLPSLPDGIAVLAKLRATMSNVALTFVTVRPLSQTATTPNGGAKASLFCEANGIDVDDGLFILSNTSKQVAAESSNANTILRLSVVSWTDPV